MRNSTSISILAVLLPIIIGAQFIVEPLANPDLPIYPDRPDMNRPSITLELLDNNATFDYIITIDKPDSWFTNTSHSGLVSVGYIIDGTQNVTIADSRSNLPQFRAETHRAIFNGTLEGLTLGSHTIQVWANSMSAYHPSDTPQNFYGWWGTFEEVPIKSESAILHFTITAPPTKQDLGTEAEPFPTSLTVAVSVTVAAAVVVGVLVYRKKQKRVVST